MKWKFSIRNSQNLCLHLVIREIVGYTMWYLKLLKIQTRLFGRMQDARHKQEMNTHAISANKGPQILEINK